MKFYYIYKALAHPEHNGYVQPFSLQERLLHVQEAKRTLGSQIPWLCDTMDNGLKHALGDAPNSEFLLDSQGVVVRKRLWSDPDLLRKDLAEIVGPVARITTVADLGLKTAPPPKAAASGVVERIPRARAMRALRIEPIADPAGEPFYAKLRGEADEALLRGGPGKLYLGFHLDPLYHAHWNNLTEPLRVDLTAPDGWHVAQPRLTAPKADAESDVDPREFLIELPQASRDAPLEIAVAYFACNDEEGWCKRIEQKYKVHLEADQDGGWVRPSGGAGRRTAGGNPQPPDAASFVMGELVRLDRERREIVVRDPSGQEQRIAVEARRPVMRDRRPSRIGELQAGDRVRIQVSAGEEGQPPTAQRIMARSGP